MRRMDQAGTMLHSQSPEADPSVAELIRHYGCGPVRLTGTSDALYDRHLVFDNVMDPGFSDARQQFEAFARSIRDILSQRWIKTGQEQSRQQAKRVCYLSMEYLLGRSLANNVTNLLLTPHAHRAARERAVEWCAMLDQEPDAGLGNGGLGRLAACFMDSLATMDLPARGYGLRYEYGMFRQTIRDGWQWEQPDNWLSQADPWEVHRPHLAVQVKLNCGFEAKGGHLHAVPGCSSTLVGVPYDRPMVGYGGRTINTLRLWRARATDGFDFQEFSSGDFVGALAGTLAAESLTRVLYPDDTTTRGQALRFVQEWFLSACSVADILREFRESGRPWAQLPDAVAIQLNDTHPTLVIPELLRILLDEEKLEWEQAFDLTLRSVAYTNHTLLPEALERWPLHWFEMMLPRHLELIYEINRRMLDDVRHRFPGDEARVQRMSLVEEGAERKIRMAHLAIAGSHSTNGVAEIHSRLLRTVTVRDFAEMFPERFSNKTNGVTPRRWLLLCNPELSDAISSVIGHGWITDLSQLSRLAPLAKDAAFCAAVGRAKHGSKVRFAGWVKEATGQVVDPAAMFDCQIKRIHEYKRQMLNALRIVVLYNRLRKDHTAEIAPRTFFFAGKAAPAYRFAKVVVKFINNLAATLDADPLVRGRLKVVFLPEYCCTLAERLIPAADVSNQISTAGYEASGTSNMKFMMNGALTLGTRDGATIEMAQAAGEDNMFMFGLTAQQVAESRGWYSPYWHRDHDADVREALDAIASNHFSPHEPGVFQPILDALLTNGDRYMHLADLQSYLQADARLVQLYTQPEEWTRKAVLNIAASGRFSSDRTIHEYARDIWNVEPCPVP